MAKWQKFNTSDIEEVKANLLNSNIFTRDKNIAFAFLKEFFIKYSTDKLTNEHVSDMLSTDMNNLFHVVRHQSEKNDEAI